MAADGGGGGPPPSPIKKEEGLFGDSNKQMLLQQNNNYNRGISIAERRAAKCGFNASNINSDRFGPTAPATPQLRSPYFTVPPGLSPSALLDSPVMLPNAQAQLSPTTGTFQFPSPNHEGLKLKLKLASNGDETIAMDSSSKPHSQSSALRVQNMPFDEFEYSREYFDDTLAKSQVLGHKSMEVDSNNTRNNNNQILMSHNDHQTSSVQEIRSTHPNQEKNHKGGSYIPKEMAKYSEDGFFWRKYGQKHVKGSEFPRSYYRCTDTNCLMRKKVERSHDGQITEIVYKGSHNHPKPQNCNKRFSEVTENIGQGFKPVDQGKDVMLYNSSDNNGLDGLLFLNDFPDNQSRPMSMFEPVENQEFSSTFCSQDGDDQNGASPDSISFNDEDDDQNGECENKKRKRESVPNDQTPVPRSTREPKVVVQIESDIDILDDGYRWRKYGQKVVKGNPNPRSYYKCTSPGCPVRKHVERAADDIKSVITTYEGKHNHHVPCSKNGNPPANSDAAANNSAPHSTAANGGVSSAPSSSSMVHNNKSIINNDATKSGKVQALNQDLPLYMETKPILNYSEMMINSNNLPPPPAGNFAAGASSSSVYPVPFPPFHSMHYNSSYMMNGTNNFCMKNYPLSKFYPTFPDYIPMPSPQMAHIPAAAAAAAASSSANINNNNMMPIAGNFHYNSNNYPITQTPTRPHEQTRDNCHAKNVVKPKEEPKG